MTARLFRGDVRAILPTLPAGSVQTCVTSPPYWGLRDYGHAGQLGLELTPEEYVANMVAVFREVRRVLRDDGTLWLNLGDSYATGGGVSQPHRNNHGGFSGSDGQRTQGYARAGGGFMRPDATVNGLLKPKDLVGIPWRVAFALQADGWYLRSDIIWSKPNPMPESVTDRPTKAHEYVFLLTKAERYYYDADAIREEHQTALPVVDKQKGGAYSSRTDWAAKDAWGSVGYHPAGRNARTVWTIATQPYAGSHFATMPEELARRCILAGSKAGDVALDPFGGSGTTAAVAVGHGRTAWHIDAAYHDLARERIGPMLCEEMDDAA